MEFWKHNFKMLGSHWKMYTSPSSQLVFFLMKISHPLGLASKFAPFLPNLAPFFQVIFFAQFWGPREVLRGALRLGMVTTCLRKVRDGHHKPRLGDPTWVWALHRLGGPLGLGLYIEILT